MAHKAVFFNFERWGVAGKDRLLNDAGLKAAGVDIVFETTTLDKNYVAAGAESGSGSVGVSGAIAAGFDIAGIFMDSKVDAATIAALPNLKCIATLSTGFDHINLAAADARGIVVCSVPAYGENTVAEFAFALLLSLSRKICEARARVRDEHLFTTDGLQGFDLAGKTIGVLGTGRIGKHAIRMAKGFGMKIVAYDVYHDDAFAAEMGFAYVSLDDLLAQSDVITIHVPNLPETHHMINQENIGRIKRGAYIINTARGAVIETPALIAALASGAIGGAGLDVLEEEEEMKVGNMGAVAALLAMPNVIMTPHNAFNTSEAAMRIIDTTIANIVAFVNGAPTNVVKEAN